MDQQLMEMNRSRNVTHLIKSIKKIKKERIRENHYQLRRQGHGAEREKEWLRRGSE